MRSRYCRTARLDIDNGDHHYLVYGSLSGNVALVDELCNTLLDDEDAAAIPVDELDARGLDAIEQRIRFLAERGFWVAGREEEQAAVDRLAGSIETLRRDLLQVLFVFHPETGSREERELALDAGIASLRELLSRFSPRRCHIHFWVHEPFQVDLFHRAIERLLDAFPAPETGGPRTGASHPRLTFVVNTHGMLPLDVRPLRLRFGMNVVLKVVVDRHFIDRFPTLNEYLTRLYAFLEDAASQGQASNLFLNAHRGSESLFRDTLLERFMERGLNRAVVTRYYLSAVLRKTRPVDFYCDLDAIDFDLWRDLLQQLAGRPRYRMFTLYGGGVVSRFQRLLSFKKTLLPDVHFCPIVANSISLDLGGNLWVCPKTVFREHEGAGVMPVGRYQPEIELNDDRLREWWDFSVRDREECRECPDAFICGGGCPLEARCGARVSQGSCCQPALEFLTTGVKANLAHLSRQFGPGVRSRR